MSTDLRKLSVATVIRQEDYFHPGFDPERLKMAQIQGILKHHDVLYPPRFTRALLIDIFNREIKAKAAELQEKQRTRARNEYGRDRDDTANTGHSDSEGKRTADAGDVKSTAMAMMCHGLCNVTLSLLCLFVLVSVLSFFAY